MALPGESKEQLEWLAREDQRRAEEGMVELRSGEEVWYKHIDDLTSEDRPARLEAKMTQAALLKERTERLL